MEKTSFGDVLKEARKKTGLSEREAASIIDVSNSTWARWERSEAYPSDLKTLDRICDLVQLNFFYMMTLICPDIKNTHKVEFQILDDLHEMTEQDIEAVQRITKAMVFYSRIT